MTIAPMPSEASEASLATRKTPAETAKARGYKVTQVYVENDTSAYRNRRVKRTPEQGREYLVYRTVIPVRQEALEDLCSNVTDALMGLGP